MLFSQTKKSLIWMDPMVLCIDIICETKNTNCPRGSVIVIVSWFGLFLLHKKYEVYIHQQSGVLEEHLLHVALSIVGKDWLSLQDNAPFIDLVPQNTDSKPKEFLL